jgi:hypothetical protein
MKKTYLIGTMILFVLFLNGCTNYQNDTLETNIGLNEDKIVVVASDEISNTENVDEGEQVQASEETISNSNEYDFIVSKMEYFTEYYFRFTREIELEKLEDEYKLSVEFIPEVGSVICKDEVLERVALHAFNINKFFPEITSYCYIVIWPENSDEVALRLEINKEEIEQLNKLYLAEYGTWDPDYASFFSLIEDTEESLSWRNLSDGPYELP